MKRYVLISVILLVAFMWSCDNKVSSPYSPEDLTTVATNSGDGTVTTAGKGGNGKGKGKVDRGATYKVEVFFGGGFFSGSHTDAYMEPNCLSARNMNLILPPDLSWEPSGCLPDNTLTGNLSLGQNINFFFKTSGPNYLLCMADGEIVGGENWPPAEEGKTTTWEGTGLWLEFHGGGGRKTACNKTQLSIFWTIEVTKN